MLITSSYEYIKFHDFLSTTNITWQVCFRPSLNTSRNWKHFPIKSWSECKERHSKQESSSATSKVRDGEECINNRHSNLDVTLCMTSCSPQYHHQRQATGSHGWQDGRKFRPGVSVTVEVNFTKVNCFLFCFYFPLKGTDRIVICDSKQKIMMRLFADGKCSKTAESRDGLMKKCPHSRTKL